MSNNHENFLITGALGCIGAWTISNLLADGAGVTVYDLASEPTRLRLVLTDDALARVQFVTGDITDLGSFEAALDTHDVTHVIHLAGLQVPFCKADPPLGARVNVVGTVNVFVKTLFSDPIGLPRDAFAGGSSSTATRSTTATVAGFF